MRMPSRSSTSTPREHPSAIFEQERLREMSAQVVCSGQLKTYQKVETEDITLLGHQVLQFEKVIF